MKTTCLLLQILLEYENVYESKQDIEENVCNYLYLMLYLAL
jgi:hypothetical protein